jgi:hypothetical protein
VSIYSNLASNGYYGKNNMPRMRYSSPEYDRAMSTFMSKVMEGVFSLHPLFGSMFKEKSIHAGPIRNVRGPEPLDQEMLPVQGVGQLHNDAIVNTDFDAFTNFIYGIAEEAIKQFSLQFYRGLDEITDATGQKFDAAGKPFSYDMYLDVIERMPIDFSDDGSPNLPTIVAGKKSGNDTLNPSEDQLIRLERILAKKKEEFDAQKRTRKLS